MTARHWQFSLKRLLAATALACIAACLLSDVPRLRCELVQVLAYFLSAAVAGTGLGALLKCPCRGTLLGVVLAGPAIPPLAIIRRLVFIRFGV